MRFIPNKKTEGGNSIRIKKKFAFLPLTMRNPNIGGLETRWLEFVRYKEIRQTKCKKRKIIYKWKPFYWLDKK